MKTQPTQRSQITEMRLQQNCFIWAWNNYPKFRGNLFMLHNTPQNTFKGSILMGAGMVKGLPDMLLLKPNGKYIFIELKLEEGKESSYQIWFAKIITLLGGNRVVIRNEDDFKKLYIENLPPFTLPEMP